MCECVSGKVCESVHMCVLYVACLLCWVGIWDQPGMRAGSLWLGGKVPSSANEMQQRTAHM